MKFSSAITTVALSLAALAPANAALIINATGSGLGFTATTVVTGLPQTSSFGPFGLSLTGNGHILTNDYANSTRYVFSDVDGQTVANALNTVGGSGSGTQGYASLGGHAYGGNGSNFVQFNDDGTVNHTLTPSISPYLGMAGDAVTGKLIATSGSGLVEIDPVANTFRVINSSVFGDGVSISPDGAVAYVEVNDTIVGYKISDGSIAFAALAVSGGPDGTGVISSTNSLNGFIVVNGNDGNVNLINPVTRSITLIGTDSGQRGDYTAPDTSNGTLLLDFSTEIARLSCGANCSIGAPPPSGVPEPSSVFLTGAAVAGLAALKLRRRA